MVHADTIRKVLHSVLHGSIHDGGQEVSFAYGQLVATAASTVVISASDTLVKFTGFNTDGLSRDTVPDHTSDHITISKAGIYLVTFTATANDLGGFGEPVLQVARDNLAVSYGTYELIANNNSASMTAILDLPANSDLELGVLNRGSTSNINVAKATLTVLQIA